MFYYTIENNTIKLIGYTGKAKQIEIPETIEGLPVCGIEQDAFCFGEEESNDEWKYIENNPQNWKPLWERPARKSLIERITLPETISFIGQGAFAHCVALKQISLPPKIKTIEDGLFSGCIKLERVSLPSVTSIGKYAFQDCHSLKIVQLPKEVKTLGNYVFYNCRALEQIYISQQIESIGLGAFKNCEALIEIALEGHTYAQSVVADISHFFTITLQYEEEEQKKAKLFFPDEAYEYIEDYPARQFHQVNYGSGHLYRQCIGNSDIDYLHYDQLFSIAQREETPWTVARIGAYRLLFPRELTREKRQEYLKYFQQNVIAITALFLDNGDWETLIQLGNLGVFTEETIDEVIELARRRKIMELLSFLMDYRHKHMTKRKKSFDL